MSVGHLNGGDPIGWDVPLNSNVIIRPSSSNSSISIPYFMEMGSTFDRTALPASEG